MTGKPVELGGSYGRESATGRGVVTVLRELCRDRAQAPEDVSVVVHGFGNVGAWTAQLAQEMGFRVVGAGDLRGAVYDKRGVDVPTFSRWLAERGTANGYPDAEAIDVADLLGLPCDALIPAATGEVINASNAASVQAETIVEAANHPVTAEADDALRDAGVTVVPDILANAGGVIASYFEWTQNIQHFRWPESRVNTELEEKLVLAYREVAAAARSRAVPLRDAAFAIAVGRVAQAIRLRASV